jgi:hypothetical protein
VGEMGSLYRDGRREEVVAEQRPLFSQRGIATGQYQRDTAIPACKSLYPYYTTNFPSKLTWSVSFTAIVEILLQWL